MPVGAAGQNSERMHSKMSIPTVVGDVLSEGTQFLSWGGFFIFKTHGNGYKTKFQFSGKDNGGVIFFVVKSLRL